MNIEDDNQIYSFYQFRIIPSSLLNYFSSQFSVLRFYAFFLGYSIILNDKTMNNPDYNCYLIRHAVSEHNIAKKNWKQEHQDPNYKESPEYAQLKFNATLVDPKVLPQVHVDIEKTKQMVDLNKTQLVLCSPMRRCLQTCTLLLKGHHHPVKVLVEPLLSSRLNSAWSVGSSIRQLKVQFPHFDYSAFAGIEDTWMLKILQRARKIGQKQVDLNAHRSKQFMLEMLASSKKEEFHEFRIRVNQLKGRLRVILKEHCPLVDELSNVVIVSHSCVLKYLTAQEFNETGKVKNKDDFQHCFPRKFNAKQFLPCSQEEKKPKL